MLTKKKVLSLALTLVKAGDISLLRGEEVLAAQQLSGPDKDRVRAIGEIVHALCNGYSYVQSASFERETKAKSASFVAMKIKMESSPVKRKERLDALFAAIRGSMDDASTLLDLVRLDQRSAVGQLVVLLDGLALPGG